MTDYSSARRPPPPREKTERMNVLIAVGFAVVMVAFVALVTISQLGVNRPTRDDLDARARRAATPVPKADEMTVWVMAQDFVSQQLAAPATAEFPPLVDVEVLRPSSDRCWVVRSYVDSENALGALIRSRFVTEVCTDDGRTWTCSFVNFL